jgi:hypothetical protein
MRLIYNILTWNTSPMVYFLVFVSQFIGLCFGFHLLVGDTESILYRTGTLVDRELWGVLLLVVASALQLGLITNNKWLTTFGGMGGFLLWLSACIDLVLNEHWYVFVTVALMHTLFHTYVYLAASLGYLEKVPRSTAL